jgi:hypothetical protein
MVMVMDIQKKLKNLGTKDLKVKKKIKLNYKSIH